MSKDILDIIFYPEEYDDVMINKYLNKYKDYIIHIPTERKTNDENETEKIPCIFIKNKNSKNILIIFHCNGLDIFEILKSYKIDEIAEENKINILMPEYPGYSIYKSPLSSEKCLEDSLIIYDFILKNIKNITEKNIYILGRSLGTGPAIYLSSKRKPAGTFLISPYTTFAAVDYTNNNEEELKALSNQFRSIDYIDKINNPLFIIHGKEDPLINYNEAIKLYDKCRKDIKKELKLVKDMVHNFGFDFIKYTIIPPIIEFVDKFCPLNKPTNNEKNNNEIIIDFDEALYKFPKEILKIFKAMEVVQISDDNEDNEDYEENNFDEYENRKSALYGSDDEY